MSYYGLTMDLCATTKGAAEMYEYEEQAGRRRLE